MRGFSPVPATNERRLNEKNSQKLRRDLSSTSSASVSRQELLREALVVGHHGAARLTLERWHGPSVPPGRGRVKSRVRAGYRSGMVMRAELASGSSTLLRATISPKCSSENTNGSVWSPSRISRSVAAMRKRPNCDEPPRR